MMPTVNVTKTFDNTAAIRRAVQKLTEQDVFIGVPEDKAAREAAGDTGISNAYLAYIHEHGVPEKNIPARAALIPGIQDIQAEATEILKDTAKKALEGNEGAVDTGLNKIGLLGQNAVRARFVSNDWAPLADSTLDRRKKVSETVTAKGKTVKKMGKSRRERGAINPLIDTSGLRKAYTYVIRKKGNTALVVK
ncbi:conserved hypothetical protein [uncultured delta proteobacterium]|uniref:Uncharacterized protein n=1 Tax=uncultured delta proteobacterium TaxID=34034 RepID=A0A212J7V9_9DELT|nr:conserved hypothetical protein [uncultured delta proteobacterium]